MQKMKKNETIVSVIVTIYNKELYIKDCVKSIMNQTYTNIEILLIDDGSTDNSLHIINKLKKLDSRIRTYSKENEGVLKTRLYGASLARGEYIIYVDADDYLEKNSIFELLRFFDNADIVKPGFIKVIEGTEHEKKLTDKKSTFYKENFDKIYSEYLINNDFSLINGQLIKRSILVNLKDINTNIVMAEDLYLNLEIVSCAQKIILLPKILYYYAIRKNSICTSKDKSVIKKRIKDSIFVDEIIINYLNKWNINDITIKNQAGNMIIKGIVNQLKALFYTDCSKKEILDIIYRNVDGLTFDKARELANKKRLNLLEIVFYYKYYNLFFFHACATTRIKKSIKKLLSFIRGK